MRFAMIVAILLLGTSTVLGYEDNTDKEDVLARLLTVLTEREEKKEEHRSLLDELEEQLEKRKEVGEMFQSRAYVINATHKSRFTTVLNFQCQNS